MDTHANNMTFDQRVGEECRMLLEHLRDVVLLISVHDGRILTANHAAADLYGHPASAFIGMHITTLLADPSLMGDPRFDPTRGGAIDTSGVLFETEHVRADGSKVPVEVNARQAHIGGEQVILAVVRDISERVAAEREIRKAYAEIEQVFETAAGGMRIIDSTFTMTRVNRTFEELAHLEPGTATGMKCYEAFAGPQCHTDSCPLVRVLGGEGPFSHETAKERVDGTRVTVVLAAQPFIVDGEVVGIIEDFHDVTDRKAAEDLAQHLATHDALTDLPNRLLFTDRLEMTLLQAEREESTPALIFADVDGFKAINDEAGHTAGDEVLRGVARAFESSVRKADTVARIGGDEFVVILPAVASARDAEGVAKKLIRAVSRLKAPGAARQVGLSVGIALRRPDEDADHLIGRADLAMYLAKRAGGNTWRVAE